MRRLIANLDLTVDGVTDDPPAWASPRPPAADAFMQGVMQTTDTLLLGWVTYQHFAAYWPQQLPESPWIAAFLHRTPRVVVSGTLERPEWAGTTVSRTLDEVAALKAQPGGTLVTLGSVGLVGALAHAGLVDEDHLRLRPMPLGGGQPLFPPGLSQPLTLLEARTFADGPLLLRYAPQGGTT